MSSKPSGWASVPLAELVDILDSKRVPINSDERATRIAGKHVSELFPYYGATGQVGWIDQAIFDEELVLLGEDGVPFHDPFKRKAYRIKGKTWVNNHAHVLRAIAQKIDIRYLEHYLNSFDYVASVTGSTRLKLTQAAMVRIPVLVAPVLEQQRIADKLDTVLARVDACRDRLARVAPLLKRFRQSVLAAATSGLLTEEWRIISGARAWIATDVQSVAEVGTGSTPLRSNAQYFAPTGTPWITSGATSQPFVTSAQEFVTDAAIKAHRLKVYPPGTLLVAMYGEGKTRGQVTELSIPATINQACAAVRVDESLARAAYVKLALQANYFEMRELAEGGNQPNLNLGKIKEFGLQLPGLDEQAEIVRRVETLFAFADRLEARLAQARSAVDRLSPSLLAKAFRGELVPQDPAEEPAAELLTRLAAQRDTAPARQRSRSVRA
ncbi:MAG: restriction endonuclease subunit S [Burkholderiales bacterium]|nr:restriction endonuclease subunit S [Burkholderiales bacterium]